MKQQTAELTNTPPSNNSELFATTAAEQSDNLQAQAEAFIPKGNAAAQSAQFKENNLLMTSVIDNGKAARTKSCCKCGTCINFIVSKAPALLDTAHIINLGSAAAIPSYAYLASQFELTPSKGLIDLFVTLVLASACMGLGITHGFNPSRELTQIAKMVESKKDVFQSYHEKHAEIDGLIIKLDEFISIEHPEFKKEFLEIIAAEGLYKVVKDLYQGISYYKWNGSTMLVTAILQAVVGIGIIIADSKHQAITQEALYFTLPVILFVGVCFMIGLKRCAINSGNKIDNVKKYLGINGLFTQHAECLARLDLKADNINSRLLDLSNTPRLETPSP